VLARKAPRLDAYSYIYGERARNTIAILTGLGKTDEAEFAKQWAVALVEDAEIRERVKDALYSGS
jgi:hypothetical protein